MIRTWLCVRYLLQNIDFFNVYLLLELSQDDCHNCLGQLIFQPNFIYHYETTNHQKNQWSKCCKHVYHHIYVGQSIVQTKLLMPLNNNNKYTLYITYIVSF